jgi:hypothetical protein
VKINDILTEAHDEDIHSWVVMNTGIDIGQLSKDADELCNNYKINPEKSTKQLEEILTTIRNTFRNNRYWNEAFKFGEVKAHQLGDEFMALEDKIEGYLKQLTTPSDGQEL